MSDDDFKPWFRAVGGLRGLWWPIHWKGFLFVLALVIAAGISVAAIDGGLITTSLLLLLGAVPAYFAVRIFWERTEWIEPWKSSRRKNDLRNRKS